MCGDCGVFFENENNKRMVSALVLIEVTITLAAFSLHYYVARTFSSGKISPMLRLLHDV